MKKRNNLIKIVIAMITFSIIFSGCGMLGSNEGDQRQSGIGLGSSSSGGNGVEITFENENIQPIKGETFSLFMKIKNYQRHEITDLEIRPTGFEKSFVSGLNNQYSETLGKATESGPNQKTLLIEGITLDDFTGNFNFNPIFKYCYSAQSYIRKQTCIPNKNNQCNIDVDESTEKNGPLSINIDRIFPLGETKIGIEVTVKDNGGGNIVSECFQDPNRNNYGNPFRIREALIGSNNGNCKPISSDEYVINEKSAKFLCEFDRSSEESYASQITISLDYKYQQSVRKNILIRDMSQMTS